MQQQEVLGVFKGRHAGQAGRSQNTGRTLGRLLLEEHGAQDCDVERRQERQNRGVRQRQHLDGKKGACVCHKADEASGGQQRPPVAQQRLCVYLQQRCHGDGSQDGAAAERYFECGNALLSCNNGEGSWAGKPRRIMPCDAAFKLIDSSKKKAVPSNFAHTLDTIANIVLAVSI
jgi:hypothetical protein